MPGKRKRLSNASPMPAYYTNTGGYNLPAVEIRGKAPQWAKDKNYYDQLANFYADRFDVNGNNSRLTEIIGRAKANPEFWNEDGSLNQKGNAYITQQKHFGVGSNYYNRMNEYAKQTAYGLAQVAGAPYLAGLTGRQLLGSTIGGTIGSMEGSEIGRRFDNPATGNYAGSELGALLGGLAGGAIGGNVKPLFRKYIKGMTKLDQAQTRYWDKKELNQLLKNPQITSTQINENIPLNTSPKVLDYYGIKPVSNPRTSLRFLERPSKLFKLEKQGLPKNERKNPISNRITPSWYRRNNIVPDKPINVIPEKALNEFANRDEILKVLNKYTDAAERDYINWQQSELAHYNYDGTDTDAMLGLTKSADTELKQSSKVLENMKKDYPFLKKFGNPYKLVEDFKFTDDLYDDIFIHGLETDNRVTSPDLDNWMTDFYDNPSDYETGNLSDIIFHRKYGGPTQKPSKNITPKKRYGGSLRRRLESGGYLSY